MRVPAAGLGARSSALIWPVCVSHGGAGLVASAPLSITPWDMNGPMSTLLGLCIVGGKLWDFVSWLFLSFSMDCENVTKKEIYSLPRHTASNIKNYSKAGNKNCLTLTIDAFEINLKKLNPGLFPLQAEENRVSSGLL